MVLNPDPPPSAPPEASDAVAPASSGLADRLADWAPSRTQVLVLAVGLLAASNIAQWIALRKDPDTRPVTVVAVRQMTRDYMSKITSPALSEQESVLRANLFIAAAQDELHRLVAPSRLVLARECVLSGTLDDVTAELQKRVESRLDGDAARSPAGPGAEAPQLGDPITGGRISAANLLSPSPAAVDRTAP